MAVIEEEEAPTPSLPLDLASSEIFVRLPVKSLLRFRSVSTPWRNTISDDPWLSKEHTRRHGRQSRGLPAPSSCLLIAPYIRRSDRKGERVEELATPGLWLWEDKQAQAGVATLMYNMAWVNAEGRATRRLGILHCDGFVAIADDEGTVRLLNPATRRILTLPDSPNTSTARRAHTAFGFGRDLGSGSYKVARFFWRRTGSLGMEVYTVGQGNGWRETQAEPPCPFRLDRTAVFFKGSLVWTVDLEARRFDKGACFVRFNLQDESFSLVQPPDWYPGGYYEELALAEINGEHLALVRLNCDRAEVWICDDNHYWSDYSFNNPWWAQRHVLRFSSQVYPIATFSDGLLFRDSADQLHCENVQGCKHMLDLTTLRYRRDKSTCSRMHFDGFDVIPYTPTIATISDDPCLSEERTRRHGRQSRSPPAPSSSLLIAPYIRRVDSKGECVEELATPGLWLWEDKQPQDGVVTLMYTMPWVTTEGRARRRLGILHCDGFVAIADAEGAVRLLNPATRLIVTLPDSPNTATARRAHMAFGFGRDLGSGAYKVARFFWRRTLSLGMEVFTVGQDNGWRETQAEPPYPFRLDRTAVYFKGSLVWTVDLEASQFDKAVCFVRFNLQDESFSVVQHPDWYPGGYYEELALAEINGEHLALVRINCEKAEVWICDDRHYWSDHSFNNPLWVRRHVLHFSSQVYPIATFSHGLLFRDSADQLHYQNVQGCKHMLDLTTLRYRRDKDTCSRMHFDGFDVMSYSRTLAML